MLNNDRRQAAVDTVPDRRVVSLLEAAAAPTEPGPLPGELEALAAFRASQHATRRPSMFTTLTSAKVVMAAAVSGLVLTGGVGAAAAAGSLPGPAQDTASTLLGKVGVTVPSAHHGPGRLTDQREVPQADDATATPGSDADVTEPTAQGKGAAVSELAKGELQGKEKGAAVSEYASGGKSQVGEHDARGPKSDAPAEHGDEAEHEDTADEASVETPNDGGSDTADDATTEKDGGASTNGTSRSTETSNGRSKAGSENRP